MWRRRRLDRVKIKIVLDLANITGNPLATYSTFVKN